MFHAASRQTDAELATHASDDSRTVAEGRSFLRHLGLAERLFYPYGQRASVNFSLAAEITGVFNEQVIASAFAQVIARHPLVAPGPTGHLAFFARKPTPEIKIHHVARAEWPSFVADSLAQPLGKDGGPFIRATVLLDQGGATVILTFHHAAANGRSAVTVLTDLALAMIGRTLSPAGLPASLEAYADCESETCDFERPIERPTGVRRDGSKVPLSKPRVTKLLIDPTETESLLDICREKGVSLHGALCVALAAVRAQDASSTEINVFSAVDLRDAVGAPDDVCAFLNGAVKTPIATDMDFWEAARSVSATAAAYREPAAVQAALQDMAAALPADASSDIAVAILNGPLSTDLEVTNLGALKIDPFYGDLTITDIWGPMPFPKNEAAPIVGVVGFGGVLYLTQTFLGDTDTLLDDLHKFLRRTVLTS
jgi:hypothetical protein